jgi:GMP synthase-like glutamine amidotransferase
MKTTAKTIEVTVAPDGRTRVETKGFAGTTCQAASHFLLRALGICTGQQRTAEYYRVGNHVANSTQLKS